MYKNEPVYNGGCIVFIPDYIKPELDRLGLTSDRLYNMSLLEYDKRISVINEFATKMNETMSHKDVRDLLVANKVLYKYLYKTNLYSIPMSVLNVLMDICTTAVNAYDTNAQEDTEFINLYVNNKIDVKSILLNGNKKSELYTTDVMTDTLFIIVHDGFTNFIVNNDSDIKDDLSVRLQDYYVERLGEKSYEKSFLITL